MMIADEKPAVAVKVAVSVVIALVAVAFVVNTRIVDDANEPEGVRKNKNLQQGKPKCFRETATRSFQHVYRNLSEDAKGGISHNAILADSRESLAVPVSDAMPQDERGEIASEKNQLMDELLDLPKIPSDYGATMVALVRDRSQDVVARFCRPAYRSLCAGVGAAGHIRSGLFRCGGLPLSSVRCRT